MTKKGSEICYICVKLGADSRDHIIPQCFFIPPLPSDLKTLPAHRGCHNKLSEDYPRLLFTSLSGNNRTAQQLWNGKVERALVRNAPMRDAVLQSLTEPDVEIVSPSGFILERSPAFKIDIEKFYPPLTKIVRGLYCYHTKKFLPAGAVIKWEVNGLYDNPEFHAKSIQGLTYPNVFTCRYIINSKYNAWRLTFFDKPISCIVSVNEKTT